MSEFNRAFRGEPPVARFAFETAREIFPFQRVPELEQFKDGVAVRLMRPIAGCVEMLKARTDHRRWSEAGISRLDFSPAYGGAVARQLMGVARVMQSLGMPSALAKNCAERAIRGTLGRIQNPDLSTVDAVEQRAREARSLTTVGQEGRTRISALETYPQWWYY